MQTLQLTVTLTEYSACLFFLTEAGGTNKAAGKSYTGNDRCSGSQRADSAEPEEFWQEDGIWDVSRRAVGNRKVRAQADGDLYWPVGSAEGRSRQEGSPGWQGCRKGVLPAEVGVLCSRHAGDTVRVVDAVSYLYLSVPI